MANVNCLRCRFRHEDNGNCTAVGGFCTAVAAAHCPLLRKYLDTGLTPEEINDLASVREISPEAEYAINKHADNIIERLDKLLHQTDDDARLRELAEADKDGRLVVLPSNKALTNADRIRTATNQQLAKQLYDNQKEFCRMLYKNLGFGDELTFSEDYSDILAWLNAPEKMGAAQEAMKDGN